MSANPRKYAAYEQVYGVLIRPKKMLNYLDLLAKNIAADDYLHRDRYDKEKRTFDYLVETALPADFEPAPRSGFTTQLSSDEQFEAMQPTASPRGSIGLENADELLRVKLDPEKDNLQVHESPGSPHLEVKTQQMLAIECP